jgi:hypothetical protein
VVRQWATMGNADAVRGVSYAEGLCFEAVPSMVLSLCGCDRITQRTDAGLSDDTDGASGTSAK